MKLALMLLVLLIVLGCTPTPTGEVVKDSIPIGGAFALTGFASGWGEAELNAATLAIEEINAQGGIGGRQLRLVVEDTQSDNTKTVSAVSKLINVDSVKVVIGPTWLDSFGGAAPLADENKIVMITPSASITAVKSSKDFIYVFSTWYRVDKESHELAEYLASAGKKRVVLFLGIDAYFQDIGANFKQSAEGLGLEIIEEFRLSPEQLDFRTELIKMKNSNPDAILFGLNNENQFHNFLKQRQVLYPESVLFTTEYFEELALKDSFNDLSENVYFIAPEASETDFSKKYKARFGKDFVFSASNAYDSIYILARGLQEGYSTSEKMREFLLSNEFDTVTFGKTSFDKWGGLTGGEFVVKKVIDNRIIIPTNEHD